ncbi:hypothetical protein BLA29_009138 [Euroglyphus maynei]|uniref:Fibronectin type-III domain-containing protein n=1 Tax=Euroglyphus maynei TaxID=6958 RepID=A0A1Y3BGH7_EURMA|nr:hypothetical protein BLA29_009138 [Euroglyphus maynei]
MTAHQRSKSNGGLKSRNEKIRCVYEFIVNNLQRKTRYGFIIQAFNSKGTGPVSTEVYAQTLLKAYMKHHSYGQYHMLIMQMKLAMKY